KHMRILDDHGSAGRESHLLPDADVPVPYGGNPIPADAAKEGWPVKGSDAAIGTGARRNCFLMSNPRMRLRQDLNGKAIGFSCADAGRHIEIPAGECALDRSCFVTIYPDV